MPSSAATLQASAGRAYDLTMPKKPRSEHFVIGDFVAQESDGSGWLAINQSQAMPRRFNFIARLDAPVCNVRAKALVAPNGEILIKSLAVDVSDVGDDAITTTSLRSILVAQLLRRAIDDLAKPIELLPDFMMPGAFRLLDAPKGDVWVGQPPKPAGRGRETPRERIIRAASAYRSAVQNGSRSPVRDVGRELDISESQASRYLKAARAEGMLDDVAPPEQGGHRHAKSYEIKERGFVHDAAEPHKSGAYVVFGPADDPDDPHRALSRTWEITEDMPRHPLAPSDVPQKEVDTDDDESDQDEDQA